MRMKDKFQETDNWKLKGWLFINLKLIKAETWRRVRNVGVSRMSPLHQISPCFDEG